MKAALYIRVSTREQIENYSIASQTERLEAFCKSKGWSVHDTYVDGGYSGASTNRPDLQRMLDEINDFDVVVVYKLDRLSRSQRDTLDLIEEHFLKNNVDFVSITETLDTSTPFGRAMIGILSVFAQLERENIAERMRNGHIKRAQEGYRVSGGDYNPSGYKRVESGDLICVPHEKEHIQETFNLYEQYHSITKVQEQLKLRGYPVWRFRRYRDILSNKLYIGLVSFAGEYYEGRHEPLVSTEQFNRVQMLLERHKGNNAHRAQESLLSGLMRCGHCGEIYMTYSSVDKRNNKEYRYRYYICKARRFPSEYPKKCMNKNWNAKKLETLVINSIKQLPFNNEIKTTKTQKINFKLLENKIDGKVERVLNLYTEGSINKNILDKQIEKLNAEKEDLLKKQKAQLIAEQNEITPEELQDHIINLAGTDFNTKQASIQNLVKNITIKDDELDIEWNVF